MWSSEKSESHNWGVCFPPFSSGCVCFFQTNQNSNMQGGYLASRCVGIIRQNHATTRYYFISSIANWCIRRQHSNSQSAEDEENVPESDVTVIPFSLVKSQELLRFSRLELDHDDFIDPTPLSKEVIRTFPKKKKKQESNDRLFTPCFFFPKINQMNKPK
jgi:hypothetical protein